MVENSTIVFNTSPLIFLSRLGYLETFLKSPHSLFYLPQAVAKELQAKSDLACAKVSELIDAYQLQVKEITLFSLANRVHERLGKGEAEAIALGIELQTDYLILDDAAARREALRLGLNVKGTLAVIKMLHSTGQIKLENPEAFYQQLVAIDFRVKRKIFEEIFKE
jgi:predicted nucleic acid-binding protein